MVQRGMVIGYPSDAELEATVRQTLDAHWVAEGYAAPHATVYPWQWLWDSCFHVLVWLELGEVDRAQRELVTAFGPQTASGFVPHINYVRSPGFHYDLWGRRDGSSITQPPMYGYAAAELARAGHQPTEEVLAAATAGLRFLLDHRRNPSGLVRVCHPWETGADDSPRWDDHCPGDFDRDRWRITKDRLVSLFETGPDGEALTNPAFDVAPVGFNALVAFNARELAGITGDDRLADDAKVLAGALADRWDPVLGTWVDECSDTSGSSSSRTTEGLLPLLVETAPGRAAKVVDQLLDPTAHGAPFGPTGVHRAEPSFDPRAYWRGPVWPQIAYLLVLAVAPHSPTAAATLARATVAGAWSSSLAEYWDPDTGEGLGALPQSWSGLALVLARRWGGGAG